MKTCKKCGAEFNLVHSCEKLMFEVKSGILIRNGEPTIGELWTAVEKRIGAVQFNLGRKTITAAYDMPTFVYNIDCVGCDVRSGRIKAPLTLQDWVDAIADEFNANQKAANKSNIGAALFAMLGREI